MTTDIEQAQLALMEPDDYVVDGAHRSGSPVPPGAARSEDEPPRPINWNLLTADEAEAEWLEQGGYGAVVERLKSDAK